METFIELVDYNHTHHTRSIATATSIAWGVVAHILIIANTLSDTYVNIQADGEATSSVWLWLIPRLQISPRCYLDRLLYNRNADRTTGNIQDQQHIDL